MRSVVSCLILAGLVLPAAGGEKTKKVPAVLNHKIKNIDGQEIDLAKYQGKVVLVVNVASVCGYTPQYEGLQALHAKYADKGLAVLGFPCNDFGSQEPAAEGEIKKFCDKNYGVKFDMFSKVKIAGKDAHPLFQQLAKDAPVRWNFEKFLIGRDGTVLARFASDVEPTSEEMETAVRKALGK